jgi:hypothetical protein
MKFYRMVLITIILLFESTIGCAQDYPRQDYPRFEVGPFLGMTETSEGNRELGAGVGGRVVANVSSRIGLEFQITVLAAGGSDQYISSSGNVKVTFRDEMRSKLNLFGLAGFGVAETPYRQMRGSSSCCFSPHVYHPALNVAGGLEFVPIRWLSLRFDGGMSTVFLRGSGELPSSVWSRPIFQISTMLRF